MKTLLLSVSLALILSSSAFAADLVTDPTPEPVAAAETYTSWTGFYAGVQLGGAFGGDTGTFALSPFTAGLQTAFSPGFSGDFDNGVVGGAHIGYDQQYGSWVIGGILDLSATDIGDKQQGFSRTPATYTIERDLDYLATLRARLGYTVTDSVLAYATGGLAYGDVDFSYSQPGSAAVTTVSGGQDSKFGYTLGGGVEAKLTENVSLGVEYLYTNLGGNDFQANLVTAAPGSPFAGGVTGFGTDDKFDFHTVQVKLSYRF